MNLAYLGKMQQDAGEKSSSKVIGNRWEVDQVDTIERESLENLSWERGHQPVQEGFKSPLGPSSP